MAEWLVMQEMVGWLAITGKVFLASRNQVGLINLSQAFRAQKGSAYQVSQLQSSAMNPRR
jgi:hypothetical protein